MLQNYNFVSDLLIHILVPDPVERRPLIFLYIQVDNKMKIMVKILLFDDDSVAEKLRAYFFANKN